MADSDRLTSPIISRCPSVRTSHRICFLAFDMPFQVTNFKFMFINIDRDITYIWPKMQVGFQPVTLMCLDQRDVRRYTAGSSQILSVKTTATVVEPLPYARWCHAQDWSSYCHFSEWDRVICRLCTVYIQHWGASTWQRTFSPTLSSWVLLSSSLFLLFY